MKQCFTLILLGISSGIWSNNLQLSTLTIIGKSQISFRVSWENSWNLDGMMAPHNHDAAWIFMKISSRGEDVWKHADIDPNGIYYAEPDSILQIVPAADGKGIFLKSLFNGDIRDVAITMSLRSPIPAGIHDLKVFGIEMVFIPEAEFYLGDAASHYSLRRGDTSLPLLVQSDNKIDTGSGPENLFGGGAYHPVSLSSYYPKGFSAFYCMKYEVSMEQYAEFLNTLTLSQQENMTFGEPFGAPGTPGLSPALSNRSAIVIRTPSDGVIPAVYGLNADRDNTLNEPEDGHSRACNFLSWSDLTAYLDWAALRPMSELEFEKICRGPLQPVPLEYAWGTDLATDANTVQNDGTPSESLSEVPPAGSGLASHGYAGPQGPLRCGFGGTDSSTRLTTGAGYYGTLEMSGNLWELCVSTNRFGALFQGIPGDGSLDEMGFSNEAEWPDPSGAGYRGGAWNSGVSFGFRDLAISDRFYAGLAPIDRRNTGGGRGVR